MLGLALGLHLGMRRGCGTPAPSPAPSAIVNAVAADGWTMTWSDGTPPTLDPVGDPQTVAVTEQGYDSSFTAVERDTTRTATVRKRLAYPSQGTALSPGYTADLVAADRPIYVTDTLDGVTNGSTRVSPKPNTRWTMLDQLLVGNSVFWEIAATHRDYRDGQMIPAVRVRASNGVTSTAWQVVSETAISTYAEDANPIETFSGTLDVTALPDRVDTTTTGLFWLEAEAAPWVGGPASVMKSEDVFAASGGNREFTRRYFIKNAARAAAPPLAYVDSAAGNDTTGEWDNVDATARSSPFQTVKGALDASNNATRGILAANGFGLGDLDGARIRIKDATANVLTSPTVTRFVRAAAFIIERDPLVSRAAAKVTMSGANFSAKATSGLLLTESCFYLHDITIDRTANVNFSGTAGNARIYFHNVTVNNGGTAGRMLNASHGYFLGANFGAGTTATFAFATNSELRMIRGVTADLNGTAYDAWCVLGSTITRPLIASHANPQKGAFVYANRWLNTNASNFPFEIDTVADDQTIGPVTVLQNLFEPLHTTTSTAMVKISADNGVGNISDGLFAYNTSLGWANLGRWNMSYDENTTAATRRQHSGLVLAANYAPQFNIKGDVFVSATNAVEAPNRLGHFEAHHGVGFEDNIFNFRVAASTYLSETQIFKGMRSEIGTSTSVPIYPMADLFVNYQASTTVAGAGGGDYRPASASPLRDKARRRGLRYDLAGVIRPLTGFDTIGAYAPTPDAAPASTTFGALTLAGAGGAPTTGTSITSGDPSGHWQIVDGFVVPVAVGVITGSYSLVFNDASTLSITVDALKYTIRTQADWNAVMALGNATLAGKTVSLRAGTDIVTNIYGASGTPYRRYDMAGAIIEGEEPLGSANMATVDRFKLVGVRNLTVRKLKFAPSAANKFWFVGEASNHCYGITLEQCHVSGAVADPDGDYTLGGYPMYEIDLVTGQGSIAGTLGDVTIQDNLIEWAATAVGFKVSRPGAQSIVRRNEIRYFYDDGIGITHALNTDCPATVEDNYLHDCVGISTDQPEGPGTGPHPDYIRFLSAATATSDFTINVSRNIVIPGTARGGLLCQGMLASDFKTAGVDSGFFYKATVIGNLFVTHASQGLAIENAKAAVILNNTVVCNTQGIPTVPEYAPNLDIGGSSTDATSSGTHRIERNAYDALFYGGAPTLVGNAELGDGGTTIAYATAFDGPAFDANTYAEALTKYNRKAAGPLDTGAVDVGAVGASAVTFPASVPNGGSGTTLVS